MKALPEGIHEGIAPEIYQADPAISRSDLLISPPARFKWKKSAQTDNATKAKDFGSAFHAMMIEPDLFDTRHIVSQYDDFRSKEARAWRDSILAKGLTIVTKQEREELLAMGMSARKHPKFSEIMRMARMELTVITKHQGTGLMIKARPDIVPLGNALVDLKSCRDASPKGFGKDAWNLEYGRQAAHYLDAWNAQSGDKKEEFVFFCVEKEPPFLCAARPTPHELIEYGRKLNNAALYELANCLKTDIWPGYSTDTERFELPGYALKELEGAMSV